MSGYFPQDWTKPAGGRLSVRITVGTELHGLLCYLVVIFHLMIKRIMNEVPVSENTHVEWGTTSSTDTNCVWVLTLISDL